MDGVALVPIELGLLLLVFVLKRLMIPLIASVRKFVDGLLEGVATVEVVAIAGWVAVAEESTGVVDATTGDAGQDWQQQE